MLLYFPFFGFVTLQSVMIYLFRRLCGDLACWCCQYKYCVANDSYGLEDLSFSVLQLWLFVVFYTCFSFSPSFALSFHLFLLSLASLILLSCTAHVSLPHLRPFLHATVPHIPTWSISPDMVSTWIPGDSSQCELQVINCRYMVVDLIDIAIPLLGIGLNDGATKEVEVRFPRGARMNRRTPLLSTISKRSTMSAGLVPSYLLIAKPRTDNFG